MNNERVTTGVALTLISSLIDVRVIGGNNASSMCVNLAGTAVQWSIQWSNKVKYLGLCICGNCGHTEVSDNVRKFSGQYNNMNIRSVLGYDTHDMCTVHLCKVYCLPALIYGCDS